MDIIRDAVRGAMYHIAGFLDHWTKGWIKPAHVTIVSLLGHVPVAWALVDCRPVLAAVLLAFFSILDALDGALARYQNSVSKSGMYFDAVSDRLKEIIVFSALAVFVYKHIGVEYLWQVVAALGTSLLVSYVKAKGEMAASKEEKDVQKLNRVFGGGLGSYEFRVSFMVIGLLFGWIEYVLPLMIAINSFTAAIRFLEVSKILYQQDQKNQEKTKPNNKINKVKNNE